MASLLSGLLAVFCFPGWNHGQLAWIALVPLILSLSPSTRSSPQSKKKAFTRGFTAGLTANLGILYWVYPTCRAGGVNIAVSLLAVSSLSAYCALYWGAFALFVRRFGRLPGWLRPFGIGSAWVALELFRTHFLTGFPWLLFGYSQWNVRQHLPLAELGGPYIVSFMLALFNGMGAEAFRGARERGWKGARAALPALLSLAGMVAGSVYLSKRYRAPEGPSLDVALVQGNIDQYKKWDAAYEMEIVNAYTRLTLEAAAGKPGLIIWPETAVPGWLPNDGKFLRWVSDLARAARTPLLVGAVTRDAGDYNAAFLFNAKGEIAGRYRKRHLVPFGEEIPFQSVLGKWIPVLNALGSFDASKDWTVFDLSTGTFGVNICFESLFPGIVRGFVGRGAGFSVNLTNDGWYLDTSAAEQHFAAETFRAVENRTWTLCATNTGVTAFVDPTGVVREELPRASAGVLRGQVLPDPRGTFYTRHGDVFASTCAFFSLAILFL